MRKLVAVVVVVAALGLGLPYAMGMLAQKRFTNYVQYLSDQSPNVSMTLKDYQRGIFRSTAKIDMTITMPPKQHRRRGRQRYGAPVAQTSKPIKLVFNETIHHGPVMFGGGLKFGLALVDSQVVLDQQQQSFLNQLFAGQKTQPEVKSELLIGYSGSYTSSLDVPPYLFNVPNKTGRVNFKGMQVQWTMTRDMQHASGSANFAGVDATMPKGTIMVGPADMSYRGKKTQYGLMVGKGQFKLPTVEANNTGSRAPFNKLTFDGANLNSQAALSGKLLNTSFNMTVGKFDLDNLVYGPGELQMAFNNLDAELLGQLQSQLRDLNRAGITPEQKQMMALSLLPNLPRLLDKGAELKINKLQYRLPEGLVKANGFLKLDPPRANSRSNPRMRGMMGMATRVNADFNLEMPKPLARKMLVSTLKNRIRKQQFRTQMRARRQQPRFTDPRDSNGNGYTQPSRPRALSNADISQKAKDMAEQQLQNWVGQGYLVASGTNYKIHVVFKNARLTVNGKPLGPRGRQRMSLLDAIMAVI